MKKVFKLSEVDCANCAAKMQAEIEKLPGVNMASVNFLLQKLTLDADEERLEEILDEAAKICRKIEPDCEIIR
jgi:copper chaperone CopZ